MTIHHRRTAGTAAELVEAWRDDGEPVCILDAAVWDGLESVTNENAKWRLVKASALATRAKTDKEANR